MSTSNQDKLRGIKYVDPLTAEAVFKSQLRQAVPYGKVEVERDPSGDLVGAVTVPVSPTKPGEAPNAVRVTAKMPAVSDLFDMHQAAKMVSDQTAQQVARSLREKVRPSEHALTLLAMAKMECEFNANDLTWDFAPAGQKSEHWMKIDYDADDHEWQKAISLTLDTLILRESHPGLSIQPMVPFCSRAFQRSAMRQRDAALDQSIYPGKIWKSPPIAGTTEELQRAYHEMERRRNFEMVARRMNDVGMDPQKFLADPSKYGL